MPKFKAVHHVHQLHKAAHLVATVLRHVPHPKFK